MFETPDLAAWLDERQRIRDENSPGPIPASDATAALSAGVEALTDAYRSGPMLLEMIRAALAVEAPDEAKERRKGIGRPPAYYDGYDDAVEDLRGAISRVFSDTDGGKADG